MELESVLSPVLLAQFPFVYGFRFFIFVTNNPVLLLFLGFMNNDVLCHTIISS